MQCDICGKETNTEKCNACGANICLDCYCNCNISYVWDLKDEYL